MNQNKICFIICQKENECSDFTISYIESLNIPEGYEVDLITNVIGESFLEGLEECINATDALYKVVLRPNVCILYPDILDEILSVFSRDEEIGIVAFQGYSKASREALFWKDMDIKYDMKSNEAVPLYESKADLQDEDDLQNRNGNSRDYDIVELFENSIFVIKGDVVLRKNLFDKDLLWAESIAMELKRTGKKIAVPKQISPWCYCDTRYFSLDGYYEMRDIFLKEYGNILQ